MEVNSKAYRIAVIIVAYNFEPWLDRCLGSVRASEAKADVIVVDNASRDNTVGRIRSDYPEVRLVETGTNLGFGRANNIGFGIAVREAYDFVFLLNQDAWIDAKTLGNLSVLLCEHPEYGLLSPVHLDGGGALPDRGFASYAGLNPDKAAARQLDGRDGIVEADFINAAFWMIPLPVLRRVGGFCPLFRHYGEDNDWVNRLRCHGYRLGYSPAVFGCHDRANRKVTHEAALRSHYVFMLSEYANIRLPWGKAFARSVLAGMKKGAEALFAGRGGDFMSYVDMSLRLLWHTCAVNAYRKTSRKGRAWLE